MDPRPRTVTVVAAFLFAATAIAEVIGLSLLSPNPLMDRLWKLNQPGAAFFHALGRLSGVPLVLLGAGTAAAAVGLLRRRKWAWWFAVLLFLVDGCGDVVAFFATGDLPRSVSGVVISSAFLYSLSRRHVREYYLNPAP